MSTDIHRLVHAVRRHTAAAGNPLRPGPAEQLVAAALGFKTLASYQAAVAQRVEPLFLDHIEHVVLDAHMVDERVSDLGFPVSGAVLSRAIAASFKVLVPALRVHRSDEAFRDFLEQLLTDDAANGSETAGPMAETNNDGIGEVDLPFDLELDKVPVGQGEVIDIDGEVTMDIDPERPYSGHRIDVKASIGFTRCGQRLFCDVTAQILEAQLDYDW